MLKIDFNLQFKKALEIIENSGKSVFITGRAGTGKSTLLSFWRGITKKKAVLLAPTGVAALNIAGQTIHSFFHFKPDITYSKVKKIKIRQGKNIYKELEIIVIDEISMVRSDLLDCVDRFMRLNGKNPLLPFGGAQMVFIGDLYQLPPVVTGEERKIFKTLYPSQYFFDSQVFKNLQLEFIELEKIYRQHQREFIDLLNAVRNNSATDKHLSLLNRRFNPEFEPDKNDFYIYLTPTNKKAEEINQLYLAKINKKLYCYQAEISGDFDYQRLPAKEDLKFKEGSQVMMVNNDKENRWVNGSVGRIVKVIPQKEAEDIILVAFAAGRIVEVIPYTWELFRFVYDEKTHRIISETIGSFTQYPFMLAWAVTIHKAQGKTFDKVVIDIDKGTFTHGQIYVALSRCTSFEGLVIKKPILKKHIFMDWRVVKFITGFQYRKSEEKLSLAQKISLIQKAIQERQKLALVYLKSNDEKSTRTVIPQEVGEMEYLGKKFMGLSGFDSKKEEIRCFRVDRILSMKVI